MKNTTRNKRPPARAKARGSAGHGTAEPADAGPGAPAPADPTQSPPRDAAGRRGRKQAGHRPEPAPTAAAGGPPAAAAKAATTDADPPATASEPSPRGDAPVTQPGEPAAAAPAGQPALPEGPNDAAPPPADPDVVFDLELEQLLPPPSREELARLEQALRQGRGGQVPVYRWRQTGALLDGHWYWRACQKLGLPPPPVIDIDLPDREAAGLWRVRRHLDRRNLTPLGCAYARGKCYAAAKRSHGGDRSGAGASGQNDHLKTDARVAAEFGVSAKTIRRDERFARAVDTVVEAIGVQAWPLLVGPEGRLDREQVAAWARASDAQRRRILAELQAGGPSPTLQARLERQAPRRPEAAGAAPPWAAAAPGSAAPSATPDRPADDNAAAAGRVALPLVTPPPVATEEPAPAGRQWPGGAEGTDDEEARDGARVITLAEWQALSEAERERALRDTAGDARFNAQGDNPNIEWARWSWNPVTGCLHACPFCYARDIANRFYPQGFEPVFHPGRLLAPRNTPFPAERAAQSLGHRNVFTCSMADLFGRWVPREWIDAVLAEVRAAPRWNFLFLSKFPQRLAEFDFPENAWVGTSVDCQARVANAEQAFRKFRAGVKWLSCEPLLEPLHFSDLGLFDWIVLGGASRSTQTPEWRPPREWVNDLEAAARRAGCRIYEKDNLWERVREYPGAEPEGPKELPEALRYLPTIGGAAGDEEDPTTAQGA